jgi:SAM-dependent methyltransferase
MTRHQARGWGAGTSGKVTATTVRPDTTDTDRALKDRHRAMWALGDYPSVATEVIPSLGATLAAACGTGPGRRVLDVAAGSGNAAIPAALSGADVVACDLTPPLLEAGRALAAARGAVVDWREGDAEALPFADGSFDIVLSCVGVMFAPHHRAAADELVRVCRPGGTIGMINWASAGFIGQLIGLMKPYAPPPPAGTQPPPLWGNAEHVRTSSATGSPRSPPRYTPR